MYLLSGSSLSIVALFFKVRRISCCGGFHVLKHLHPKAFSPPCVLPYISEGLAFIVELYSGMRPSYHNIVRITIPSV